MRTTFKLLFMSFEKTVILHFHLILPVLWARSSKFISVKIMLRMPLELLCSNTGHSYSTNGARYNDQFFVFPPIKQFAWDQYSQKLFFLISFTYQSDMTVAYVDSLNKRPIMHAFSMLHYHMSSFQELLTFNTIKSCKPIDI